jgi:hypothetical protein
VSVVVWVVGWNYVNGGWVILVPVFKLFVGVSMMARPNWRRFGGGIVLSIATGLLVLFGQCAANFSVH